MLGGFQPVANRAGVDKLIAPDVLRLELAQALTRATDSDNRRPQPRVTIASEVADVDRGDSDSITRLADGSRTGRQDHVCVEGVRRSSRYAALASVSPEQGSLTPLRGSNGDVDKPARRNQIIESSKRSVGPDARQFPANFVVSDLRDNDADTPNDQSSEPLAAVIGKR
jgi:hypothetical protein